MTDQQPAQPIVVNNNVQSGIHEVNRIVSTMLLFGAIGAGLWQFAQGAMADLIGVATTAGVAFFAVQLWKRGVIGPPSRARSAGPRAAAKRLDSVRTTFLRRCKIQALIIIAVVYGAIFLGVREPMSVLLAWAPGGEYISVGLTAALFFAANQVWERRAAGVPFGGQPGARPARVPIPDDLDDEEWLRAKAAQLTAGSGDYLLRCHPGMLVAAALGYGASMVVLREFVTLFLGVFHNLILAVAVAAIIAAFVIKPDLASKFGKTLINAGVLRPENRSASAPAPEPVSPPAPVQQPAQAPAAPEPTAQPAPAPVRVVRKKTKPVAMKKKVQSNEQ